MGRRRVHGHGRGRAQHHRRRRGQPWHRRRGRRLAARPLVDRRRLPAGRGHLRAGRAAGWATSSVGPAPSCSASPCSASVPCWPPLAPGSGVLIAARLVQGVGAALILPASIEIVAAHPPSLGGARRLPAAAASSTPCRSASVRSSAACSPTTSRGERSSGSSWPCSSLLRGAARSHSCSTRPTCPDPPPMTSPAPCLSAVVVLVGIGSAYGIDVVGMAVVADARAPPLVLVALVAPARCGSSHEPPTRCCTAPCGATGSCSAPTWPPSPHRSACSASSTSSACSPSRPPCSTRRP